MSAFPLMKECFKHMSQPPKSPDGGRGRSAGPVPGDPTTGCELLSLGVAGATQDGHPPVILGVARQASLITWDLPRSLWGGLLPSPRRTGERVSPHQRHAPPLRHPVAGSPKSPARPITPHPLSGTLASASFWADGLSLLLVAGSGWLYLESDMAQFEGGPQHLVPRDAGDAAELRGPPLCGTEGPSAVAGGPAATWARVPGLGADTGSAAAEEGRRDSGARAGCHPLAELQGGCLIRPRGSPAEEVSSRRACFGLHSSVRTLVVVEPVMNFWSSLHTTPHVSARGKDASLYA